MQRTMQISSTFSHSLRIEILHPPPFREIPGRYLISDKINVQFSVIYIGLDPTDCDHLNYWTNTFIIILENCIMELFPPTKLPIVKLLSADTRVERDKIPWDGWMWISIRWRVIPPFMNLELRSLNIKLIN